MAVVEVTVKMTNKLNYLPRAVCKRISIHTNIIYPGQTVVEDM